jgi:tRNA pseudouridine38-40 synthase
VVAFDALAEPELKEVNALLPEDIAVLAASGAGSGFNPRTQARSKHYRYVCRSPEDFDLRTAREGAELLEGEHDFGCFCKHERGRATVGRLDHADVVKRGDVLVFDFISPAFLWQQVRRMVWALLAVGTGGLSLDDLKEMIEGRAGRAARPAQAEGLFLAGVRYPSLVLRPDPSLAQGFIKHLRKKAHPVYREMLRLLLAEKSFCV